MNIPQGRPYRALDAPGLRKDFEFSLVDWSVQDMIYVALGTSVYYVNIAMYDGPYQKEEIKVICADTDPANFVTSLKSNDSGELLAVGMNKGWKIWDLQAQKVVCGRSFGTYRSLAWNENVLAAGSQARIFLWDIREPQKGEPRKLKVLSNTHDNCDCKILGVQWSPDTQQLASTDDSAVVNIWDQRSTKPCLTFTEHVGRVKALAWSPHHRGLLMTGGGSRDCTIRFWDTITGVPMQRVRTSSQTCAVAWSKHSNELVTTHGGNAKEARHLILLTWKYPELKPQDIVNHPRDHRLLHVAMSPDGESIVGGSNQTLEFWRVFPKDRKEGMV
ncbi:hypothetical protein PRIPAC_90094 [Pristionchus pacificus]|uniref:WD40 domain-containing protein n=1 Tax=Pristionchus pacificus TaxID=54126 RepID=A0A2A6B6G3_PRIPA|nr:hypothetical protein PRIPAC_90094 [Pristionchus pacificus]|eukprot:PDM61467.1 WD40 domain-containing protein [Pristionchus pacificus]